MYYLYDENSEIYLKSDSEPTEGLYCITDKEFDLTLYRVIVGMVDENKNLTYYTQKAKPAEQLAQSLKESQQIISSLQIVTNTNPIDTSTLEGSIQNKLRDLSNTCKLTIYSGIDVTTSVGLEHFSLTDNDQINISTLHDAIEKGATQVPYHADGNLCRMFTSDELTAIYNGAKNCVTYNTTLYNHLSIWVKRCTTIDEVNAITYTSTLPDDLLANFNTIMGITA